MAACPEGDAEAGATIARLIIEARGGSQEAVGQLLALSRPYLLVIANAELPAELQAKGGASDLVQEAQLEAVRDFGAFRGHTVAELLGWLREILRHNLQDFTWRFKGAGKRRTSREVSLSQAGSGGDWAGLLPAEQSSPSSHLQHQERNVRIEAAVEELPEAYRQVLLLRHREGCSFEDISERMDRSVGAIRKLWWRAIQQLQERLQPADEPHE